MKFFSQSMRTAFSHDCFHSILIIHRWSAVARGAVLRGLEGGIYVSSRKARRHYGTVFAPKFVPGSDPKENLIYCSYTGQHLCNNSMKYYVQLVIYMTIWVDLPANCISRATKSRRILPFPFIFFEMWIFITL